MKIIVTPFRFSGGRVAITSDPDTIVRQKIVDYLTTSASERFNLPFYGFNLSSFLFEPIDSLVKADIRMDVLPGLQRAVSGVTILDFDIEQSEMDPSTATVTVTYSLPLSSSKTFTFQVVNDLNEESAL